MPVQLDGQGSREERAALRPQDRELQLSEERLKLFQKIGGVGVFDYRIDDDSAVCSPEFCSMLGLDPLAPVNLSTWAQMVHPDDRDVIVAEVQQAITEKTDLTQTYRIIRADNGEVRWIHGQSTYLPEESGQPARFVGGLLDVTTSKETEIALRETSRRLDAILNNTQMAIFLMDDRQHCVFMNKAAETLTGYTFAETVGRPLHDVVHNKYPDGRDYPLEECPIDRAFPERNQVQGEEIFVHKDGSFYPVSFTASPIRNDSGEPIGTIIEAEDIATLKRDERLRDAQNRVLEQALENRPIGEPLTELIRTVEECSKAGLIGSILLLGKDGCLHHGAAVQLPDEYVEAIDGVAIGPNIGSCGTAAYLKQAVHVSDIASDERWKDFRELALSNGLAACWSTPILSGKQEVLGTFAMYYPTPMDAPDDDLRLVEFVTRSASLIIERDAAQRALSDQAKALATLNQVGTSLAAELDVSRIVQIVTDSGVALSNAAFGAFFHNVVDEEKSYMLYTLSGVERSAFDKFPMPRATKVFHPTFAGEKIIRSADILADPRYGQNAPYHGMPKGHLPVRSYLAVPVISRTGEVIGGLFFGHPEPDMFSDHHENLLAGLAGQAAVAIDNARLFEEAQREIRDRRDAEDALRDLNANLEQRVELAVAERERAEEALRQAQKMEAVGQLTGGIAHDFNNLLTVIVGNIDTANRMLGESVNPRLSRALTNAMTGAERATTLTQRLLAFSRRQPLAPKSVEPNRLVQEMSNLLQRTLGEAISVETNLAERLWKVEVDPNQLESAIINLAVNARDAIHSKNEDSGGKLTIETANVHLDRKYAAKNVDLKPGQYVAICISDDGAGMDDETAKRAFEPFFTTKEVGKGTGLGLSMVYGFVKQSGGHVSIYSEVGEGTTIKIYLPRYTKAEEKVEIAQPKTVAPVAGQGTILVCEDDDDVRAYTVELLRELGYRVLEAHDGNSALRLLERQEGNVDLLFTDVILPGGMTGAIVAARAAEIQPGLKILFTTGYARNAIVHQGRLDEGVELITKPFSYSELSKRIHEILS